MDKAKKEKKARSNEAPDLIDGDSDAQLMHASMQ